MNTPTLRPRLRHTTPTVSACPWHVYFKTSWNILASSFVYCSFARLIEEPTDFGSILSITFLAVCLCSLARWCDCARRPPSTSPSSTCSTGDANAWSRAALMNQQVASSGGGGGAGTGSGSGGGGAGSGGGGAGGGMDDNSSRSLRVVALNETIRIFIKISSGIFCRRKLIGRTKEKEKNCHRDY